MNLLGKVMALVLLAVVVSPVVLGQVYVSTRPGPAGCHEHGQRVPAPSPVTYQCCWAGHQIAAVREAVNLRAAFVRVSRVVEFSAAASVVVVGQTQARPLDLGSPGVTALRI